MIYDNVYRSPKTLARIKTKERKKKVLEELRKKSSGQSKSNKELKKRYNLSLYLFAEQLNEKLSKSEQWFHEIWRKLKMSTPLEETNLPLGEKYIPDLVCEKFKYVIEIHGSSHNTKEQKKRDREKDCFYSKLGYKVFRIKAFDVQAVSKLKEQILLLRPEKPTRVILRKTNR